MATTALQHHTLSPTRSMSILSSATTSTTAATPTSSMSAFTTTRPRQSSNPQSTAPIVVRALYDYYSEDATNLSFQAGTLIRVLTQLDSGWWDGFIGGERGWFPSNFVTKVDSSALLEDDEDDDEYLDQDDSSSLPSADEDEGERILAGGDTDDELMLVSAADEFGWIPQVDKDGRTFYLNTTTGETTWDLPGQKMFADEWDERRIDDDEDIAPRSSMESDASEENILMLGPSLTPKSSAQNYNRLSIQSASSRSSRTKTNSVGSAKQLSLTPSFPAPPPAPTYETLFPPLRTAVDRLCAAASTCARTLFQPYADEIVAAVSTISASIPRDHRDPQIERFLHYSRYRPMVAALCSLITSTKLAAGDWSPDAQIRKMERDANEVLLRAEAFLDYAQQVDVHPRRVKPFFIQPEEGDGKIGGGWTTNLTGLSDMQPDHLEMLAAELDKEKENVERCVKAMGLPSQGSSRGRKNSLVIVDDHLIIPFLLITVQETLNAVSTFTTLVEKADLSSLTEFGDGGHRSPTIADYATAKQELYNAIGDLVIASQEITSTEEKESVKVDMTVPPKSRKRKTSEGAKNVIKAGESLKTKVHSVCLNMSFMVEEEKMRRRRGSANDASPNLISGGTAGSFASGDFSQRSRSQVRDPASKVKKIFGDDAPSPPPIQKTPTISTTTDTAWFLKHDLEDDLAYDVKGQVKGGTLDALIERLTRHDVMDSTFNSTFLLTFKSFTTAEELFVKLKGRFDIQPPSGLSDTELDLWKEKVQSPIRFRVLNTFKSWMNNFYTGSPNDPILPAIKEWALTDLRQALPSANSQTLINCVEAQQTQAQAIQKVVTVTRQNAPPPVLPKKLPRDGKGLKLLDVHAVEIARQITIQQMGLYMKIKVIDCLDKAWSGDNASPDNNIKRMIYHANKLTGWAAESILMAGDIKRRVTMLKHWVQIADRCLAINNFSGLMSIISALNSTPIHRLKRTWEMVPSKTMQTFDELNKVMHSTMNFSVYREKIHTVSLPCLPFLGVYLSDLTFIEDGNPNMLRNNEKLINFSKRMKTAEVIRDLQQYQTVSYPFTKIIELQAWLDHELTNSSEILELYDLSTQVEPREREDEKMYSPPLTQERFLIFSARLLQESGFL